MMVIEVPAHIQPPPNIVLRQSMVDKDRIGVFCKNELIQKGWEVGPFKGRIVYNKNSDEVDQKFSWEVYDLETFKFLHIVDATNADHGNWMRYVCCARFFEEQNIVSSQNGTEVYYRALKDIQPGEELLTWFQPKKKKKRSSLRDSKESAEWIAPTETAKDAGAAEGELGTGKRKRKPKIIPDSYQGPLDFKCTKRVRKTDDDDFEPLQPGQKRRRRKNQLTKQERLAKKHAKITESVTKLITPSTTSFAPDPKSFMCDAKRQPRKDSRLAVDSKIKAETPSEETLDSRRQIKLKRLQKKLSSTKINGRLATALREANKLVEWQFPAKGKEYVFKLEKHHLLSKEKGKKAFVCDICQGLYQQVFSLKRHYLRNHINYKYISKADIDNCAISLVHHQQMLFERSLLTDWRTNKNSEQSKEVSDSHSFFEKLDKTVKPLDSKGSSGEYDTINNHVKQECPEPSAETQSLNYVEKLTIKQEPLDPYFDDVQFQSDNQEKTCIVKSEAVSVDDNEAEEMTSVSNKISKEAEVETNTWKIIEQFKKQSSQERNRFEKGHNDVPSIDRNQKVNVESQINRKLGSKIKQMEDLNREKAEMNGKQDKNVLNAQDNVEYDTGETDGTTGANTNNEKSSFEMPGLYRCFTCYTLYDTVQDLKDHLDDHPSLVRSLVCDKCNMRFRLKQNLRRHQKVHENEKPEAVEKKKKIWAKAMGDDRKMEARKKLKTQKKDETSKVVTKPTTEVPKGTTTVVPKGTTTIVPKGTTTVVPKGSSTIVPKGSLTIVPKGTSDNLFKCNKCKTLFPNQTVLTIHVQTRHKDGGKFQCQYCGKDFPSLPNMKKHVRFHLGYRVRCRACDEVFSNVGSLRQHTRHVHPEIYVARREKLEKNKETNAVVVVNDKVAESKEKKETAKPEKKLEITEKLNESNKESEDFLLGTDITFEAHEIDDGGSRFKYSCTVCKKRFSSYINMCRHRRKVHSSENKQKLEEGLIFTRKSKNSTPPVVEDRKELEHFYANVSHNIAINLNCFIDGKPESLEKYTDHIIVDDYKGGSFGYSDGGDAVDRSIAWEQYNFPPNFKPVLTLPVADPTVNRNNSELISDIVTEEKTVTQSSVDDNLDTSDSVVDTENSIAKEVSKKACDIDEFEENSYSDSNNRFNENSDNIEAESQFSDQSEVFDTIETDMGKSSTGIKTFASIGLNAVQKIAKSFENLTGDTNKKDIKDTDALLRNSLTLKNFCHVENGEYANFDDLMLGDDFSVVARDSHEPIRSRALSSASTRQTKKKCRYRRSHSAGDLIDSDQALKGDHFKKSSEDLYKATQAEIDGLYDTLEMGIEYGTPGKVNTEMECDTPGNVPTPKSLRKLCEKMLGLKTCDSKAESKCSTVVTKSDDGSSLLSNLALSVNHKPEVTETGMNKVESAQDYADENHDSPFCNYETIAFGKNGDITKVCAVCKIHFADFDSLIHHHWKKHPSSACNFLEVEDGNDIESLHFAYPSTVGAIAVTDPGLDTSSEADMFTCTRCENTFKSKARLHIHIVNCSPIDPVYGALKPNTSPVKSPVKKNIKQKFHDCVDQNIMRKQEPALQKRIFTGCRKRTAMLLPDPPIKMMMDDKSVNDIISGYNPNKHIRRRELTELVDTLTCEACGLKFKTILLLERHVKNCAEKEKFKHVRPLTCPIMDESLAKIKNICFYCDKNFTYAKSLINHFQDFCPVKKMKVDQDNMTEEDMMKEREIIDRLKKQEEDKVSKDKEMEGQKKRPWQVGRKPKRKGHSWTYIKRRRQISALSENGQDGSEMEVEDNFVSENDLDEMSLNCSFNSSSDISPAENICFNQIEESAPQQTDANGNFVLENKIVKMENSSNDFDEVDSYLINKEDLKNEETNETFESKDNAKIYGTENEVETNATLKSPEPEKMDTHISDKFLHEWDRDANTSLDFTTRYKVNQVTALKKEDSKKPLIFQCVTSHDNIKASVTPTQTAERSKRKRERCGKVEAFLQNVFKRKKRKEAIKQNIPLEDTVTKDCKNPTQDKKASKKKELEQNKTSGTYRAIAPKFAVDTCLALPVDDISLPTTGRPRSFRQESDEMITTVSSIANIEVRREPSGKLRYLFKGGRRSKYPKVVRNTDLEDQLITGDEDKDLQIYQSLPNLEPINKTISDISDRPKAIPRDIIPKGDFSLQQFQTYNASDHGPKSEGVQEKVDCSDNHLIALSALESTKPNLDTKCHHLDTKCHPSTTVPPCNINIQETQREACPDNIQLSENSGTHSIQKLNTLRNTNSRTESEVNKSLVSGIESESGRHKDKSLLEKDDLPEMACESKTTDSSNSVTSMNCPINDQDISINVSDSGKKPDKESTAKVEIQKVEIVHSAEDDAEKSLQSAVGSSEKEMCKPENVEVKCECEQSQNDVDNIEIIASAEHKSDCSKSGVDADHNQGDFAASHIENVSELSSNINKTVNGVCGNKQYDKKIRTVSEKTLNEEVDETQNMTEKSEEKNDDQESRKHLKTENPLEPENVKMEESGESGLDFYTSVILSPSERVKTNKRSCKKDASPFTPVWVKQQKSRTKTVKVKDESESKVNQTVTDEKKKSGLEDSENSSTSVFSGDLYLKKDIPKALQRKLEIVSRFDSRNKAMQKKK